MAGQIVEITNPRHLLHKSRGFLQVKHEGDILGQVPLDDIAAVIISVPGCMLSSNVLDQFAHRNIPIVTCGDNYLPSSWTLPIQGHNRQFQTMRAQAMLTAPRRKRAWQIIVKAKITNQAEVLERAGKSPKPLQNLANRVRSGDPENHEAQAARIYWRTLFGDDFRRDRAAQGLNAALNYSYAIIRACIARGVVSAGLHPSFSLHHKNPQNPLNLVDDLIEPFRPIADYLLWHHVKNHNQEEKIELDRQTKTALAALINLPLPMADESSPLSIAAAKTARSLAGWCMDERDDLLCPKLPLFLEMAALTSISPEEPA